MLENIPAEMRDRPQWVCAGPDKKPINPRTGRAADPADPSTGGTFEEALHAGMTHVGYILSKEDPFTIIDLDDPHTKTVGGVTVQELDEERIAEVKARHSKIYEAFPTYTELSQSGKGVHLIVKGRVPRGFRRDRVEVYSDARYMICTGNVIRNFPVADCQTMLDVLAEDMGRLLTPEGDLVEEEPTQEDAALWRMATSAANGEKFVDLCRGDWDKYAHAWKDGSQSEADFSLLSMLCFYSRSNEQVRRMFRQTALGQREKATKNDVYLDRSLRRIRAREAPLVDLSKLLDAPLPSEAPPVPQTTTDVVADEPIRAMTFPPGIVGEVADYFFRSAIRPVPEIALAAALAFVAGIAGRAYNVSGTGLNMYLIVLADTGRGKEGAATGIDNLMAEVKKRVPMADRFLGPAAFASGQALVRVVDERPCFVSVLGEVGLLLQQLCSPHAPAPQVMLRRVLLDLYSKSGFTKVLRSSVYSDSEKNTKIIQAPNVTILGESTPSTFYGGLDAGHIAEGLIPRFSIVEYLGLRPRRNKFHSFPPDAALVDKIAGLLTVAVRAAEGSTCTPVRMDPQAEAMLDAFDEESDDRINNGGSVEMELYNRAHLKALKLAGLIAVGVNPHSPTITADIVEWTLAFVRREISTTLRRFSSGDVGTGLSKQEAEIRRLFDKFQTLTHEQKSKYRCPDELLEKRVLPFHYLNLHTRSLGVFRNDRRGEAKALAETLANMVKAEVLEVFPLAQTLADFGTRSPIYYPGPAW